MSGTFERAGSTGSSKVLPLLTFFFYKGATFIFFFIKVLPLLFFFIKVLPLLFFFYKGATFIDLIVYAVLLMCCKCVANVLLMCF